MLPNKFSFLENIGTLPKMVAAGLQLLGLKEYPGPKSNPVIMEMARRVGVSQIYKNDDEAWCALAMCYLCVITGKPMPFTGYEVLRAKSFLKWGIARHSAELGDMLILERPGGFHDTIYIAESKSTYFGLGGNQSNMVTISEFPKERLVGIRRYYAVGPPASVKKYIVESSGLVSLNER